MAKNPDRETRFRFKQFEVSDCVSAMKVGTDGVLLGVWCPVEGVRKAVDVGTGTGLIALMLAQRGVESIYGVEIDKAAAEEAAANASSSIWSDRIKIECADINSITFAPESVDLIISNPPFFSSALKSPDDARATARHENGLNYESLIALASKALAPNGKLAVISPADRESDITFLCAMYKMWIVRKTYVKASPSHAAKRLLWVIARLQLPCSSDTLCIKDENNRYSDEYIRLTRDFYLYL